MADVFSRSESADGPVDRLVRDDRWTVQMHTSGTSMDSRYGDWVAQGADPTYNQLLAVTIGDNSNITMKIITVMCPTSTPRRLREAIMTLCLDWLSGPIERGDAERADRLSWALQWANPEWAYQRPPAPADPPPVPRRGMLYSVAPPYGRPTVAAYDYDEIIHRMDGGAERRPAATIFDQPSGAEATVVAPPKPGSASPHGILEKLGEVNPTLDPATKPAWLKEIEASGAIGVQSVGEILAEQDSSFDAGAVFADPQASAELEAAIRQRVQDKTSDIYSGEQHEGHLDDHDGALPARVDVISAEARLHTPSELMFYSSEGGVLSVDDVWLTIQGQFTSAELADLQREVEPLLGAPLQLDLEPVGDDAAAGQRTLYWYPPAR